MSDTWDEAVEAGAALAAVIEWVTNANEMVRSGHVVPLDGLDERVAAVCERVAALPPDARENCRDAMVTLIDEFDRLATELRAQRDSLGAGVRDLTDRSRAVAAYGGAPRRRK